VRDLCDEPLNAFPYNPVVSMALDHLIRWVGEGVAPPRAERIAVVGPADAPTAVERDEHGNAVGGVRTTTVDVPTATRGPLNTPENCVVFGNQHDFTRDELVALYGDHATYVDRVDARLEELTQDGWFLPQFAAGLQAAAMEFAGFE
jgi:hypothetical protein